MKSALMVLFMAMPAFACEQPAAIVAKVCEARIKNSEELWCGKEPTTAAYRADCRANCGYEGDRYYQGYLWDASPWVLPAGYPPPPAPPIPGCQMHDAHPGSCIGNTGRPGMWDGSSCSTDEFCIVDGSLHADPNDPTSSVIDSPDYCSNKYPARHSAPKRPIHKKKR